MVVFLAAGISLSPDQWRTLVNRAGDVSGAIEIVEEDRVDDQDAVAKLGDCIVGVDAGEDRAIAFNVSFMAWHYYRVGGVGN